MTAALRPPPPPPCPTHHPDADLLSRHAAGTLPDGPALVVATHLDFCPACRRQVRAWEALGGALLNNQRPVALADDALERTLAKLDGVRLAGAPPDAPALDPDPVLPPTLRRQRLGPWRFVAPGIRGRAVRVDPAEGYKVMLFRVAAGMTIPKHGHRGQEYTCVIDGAFSDTFGRFGTGDMAAVDASVEHQPLAAPDGDCLCLIAVRGRLRIHSLLGRLVQPLVGL
ncbi:ChrR family anti-sigma-E factor [Nitrospirillum sp. BR 11163]|uniref:ChrR family anti-sigma-E factor n=1 Tax=Nitrospirillum sp. BR 11163 TaxID=3104323 RepID=UPI002AFF39BE|nr:ChrR family anti-sigma-E factor [Nitrospirillum sp. BR 11163]MEA1674904.1 ChrR family anti-sigma-E factor [Nitrospirillum sp. BR 11163]